MANQYPGTDRLFNVGASSGGGWQFASVADYLNDKSTKAGLIAAAQEGDYFFDTTFKVLRVRRDSEWVIMPSVPGSQPTRAELYWQAGKQGKPGINADIQNAAEAVRMIADTEMELQGTGVTSASSALLATGGVSILNQAGANNQAIIAGHTDASQTGWGTWVYLSNKEIRWGCSFVTGSDIGNTVYWAGLKKTATSVVATDADQLFFRYENGVAAGVWQAVSSIANVDDALATSGAVATATKYTLEIAIDSDRIGRMFINNTLVKTTSALTSFVALKPYIGVEATAGVIVRNLGVYGMWVSRIAG